VAIVLGVVSIALGVVLMGGKDPAPVPDPGLPDELVAQLRQRRETGAEMKAVRELGARCPHLGLVPAGRIVRRL
jgi:hypothetical protein